MIRAKKKDDDDDEGDDVNLPPGGNKKASHRITYGMALRGVNLKGLQRLGRTRGSDMNRRMPFRYFLWWKLCVMRGDARST